MLVVKHTGLFEIWKSHISIMFFVPFGIRLLCKILDLIPNGYYNKSCPQKQSDIIKRFIERSFLLIMTIYIMKLVHFYDVLTDGICPIFKHQSTSTYWQYASRNFCTCQKHIENRHPVAQNSSQFFNKKSMKLFGIRDGPFGIRDSALIPNTSENHKFHL